MVTHAFTLPLFVFSREWWVFFQLLHLLSLDTIQLLDRTQNKIWSRHFKIWYICIPNFISIWYPLWRKWTKTANNRNFSMSMGHTSVEKCSILPQIKLDLDVITINLHTKFYFNSASSANKLNRNCWWTVQPSPTNRRIAAKQYALPSSKGGKGAW